MIYLTNGAEPEFICHAQHKRNVKLDTFRPCNNCIFWRWFYPLHKYKCRVRGSYLNKRGGEDE